MDRIADSVKSRAYQSRVYQSIDLKTKVKHLTDILENNTENYISQPPTTTNSPEKVKGLNDIAVKKPLNKLRYHIVGAGRNNQIHASLGNLQTYNSYVGNLRKYENHTNPQLV